MTAQPVICPSCGWQAKRRYVEPEAFARIDGPVAFGACRHCQTPMVRRARALAAQQDAQAKRDLARFKSWRR